MAQSVPRRFNRHRPALCFDCGKPLSVRERREGGFDFMRCAWHANDALRSQFGEQAFWISEGSEVTFQLPDEKPQTFTIDPFKLFGQYGDLD